MGDSNKLWGISAYFNPMHWRRRRENYHVFRRHLNVPLVTVELGYDGCFDLQPGDADILVQLPGHDVLWQKERLLNLALARVPEDCAAVAWLDCDILFERVDWVQHACSLLEDAALVQLYSEVVDLPLDWRPEFDELPLARHGSPSFGHRIEQGISPRRLAQEIFSVHNPETRSHAGRIGMAWAFRRGLFARRGLYDRCIVGGGDRPICYAACGLFDEVVDMNRMNEREQELFFDWARPLFEQTAGRLACVPGKIFHLWHGASAHRRYRLRFHEFSRFAFDPLRDIALDEHGVWRWNSDKPEMHRFVRDYFAGRHEDG